MMGKITGKTQFIEESRKFAIKGFEQIVETPKLNGKHKHVLMNKEDNFFKYDNFRKRQCPIRRFHHWAGSLTSSQAFAYNIFSGVAKAEFEYDMWALSRDEWRKACVDVAIENEDGVLGMYEVKMFEVVGVGINKIFHERPEYLEIENYHHWSTDEVAKHFKSFIEYVNKRFEGSLIYGGGIKQLCCHLLGITNEMTNIECGKYQQLCNKKVRLYSLCFDHDFGSDYFTRSLNNYQEVLDEFSLMIPNYLENVGLQHRIKYCGYLGASEYIEENKEELSGTDNFEYVNKRYFQNTLK